MSEQFVVELRSVSKSYPATYRLLSVRGLLGKEPRRTVLHDIDLGVRRGEIFGLLGPNGAGKTTLLKMMATLLLPDRGSIRIAGIDAVAHPLEAKRRIGFSIADRGFYWRLSVRSNLRYFGELCDLGGKALDRRIDEVLEIVDLRETLDRRVKEFSSGMMQRLGLARALLRDPEILLFDEPTRAVDPVHALELRTMMRETLAGALNKTLVVSTNILEEAWSVCDRVGIISDGRLAALGSPEALAAQFADRRRFAIAFDKLDAALPLRLGMLEGVESVEVKPTPRGEVVFISLDLRGRNLTDVLAAVSANGSLIRSFREVDDALFDVFRATTQSAPDA